MILFEGPETVAAVILEPVQNSGGCFTPQEGYWERVREICDKHGVLLISDEVICSWGRLGHYFGVPTATAISPGPDHDREGPHLGVRADGRGDRLRPDRRAIHAATSGCSPTGSRSAGTRCLRRWRSRTSTSSSARTYAAMYAPRRGVPPDARKLREDLPIVGDVRGTGFFHALELVKDKETKESFSAGEAEDLLRGFMSGSSTAAA